MSSTTSIDNVDALWGRTAHLRIPFDRENLDGRAKEASLDRGTLIMTLQREHLVSSWNRLVEEQSERGDGDLRARRRDYLERVPRLGEEMKACEEYLKRLDEYHVRCQQAIEEHGPGAVIGEAVDRFSLARRPVGHGLGSMRPRLNYGYELSLLSPDMTWQRVKEEFENRTRVEMLERKRLEDDLCATTLDIEMITLVLDEVKHHGEAQRLGLSTYERLLQANEPCSETVEAARGRVVLQCLGEARGALLNEMKSASGSKSAWIRFKFELKDRERRHIRELAREMLGGVEGKVDLPEHYDENHAEGNFGDLVLDLWFGELKS